jgi:hypothetical protein
LLVPQLLLLLLCLLRLLLQLARLHLLHIRADGLVKLLQRRHRVLLRQRDAARFRIKRRVVEEARRQRAAAARMR